MTRRLGTLEQRGADQPRADADPTGARGSSRSPPTAKPWSRPSLPEHLANEKRLLAGMGSQTQLDLARLLRSLAVTLGDRRAGRAHY